MNHFVGMKSIMETRFGMGHESPELNEDMAHARRSGQLDRTGLFGGMGLGGLFARLRDLRQGRRERLHLAAATERLALTSPHLLTDVGMEEVADVVVPQDLGRHLAKDVGTEAPAAVKLVPAAVIALPLAQDAEDNGARYRLAAE